MKLLFIRFSSIGDIVLTTPLLRCTKQQIKNVEIHFVTKKQFEPIVLSNPYIQHIYSFSKSIFEITTELKNENYDYIIDLHHNLRSLKLKLLLAKPSFSFNKLNFEKWLYVNFKINKLPSIHIVDRYFETLKPLGVLNDHKGLEYFILKKDEINVTTFLPHQFLNGYNALVIGGSYYTKQIPLNKLIEICNVSQLPLVILGSKDDVYVSKLLHQQFFQKTFNAAGLLNINQSASIIKQAQNVITSDTGLMHMAAAFKKNIFTLWGNTTPEIGMGPYETTHTNLEVLNLSCRPCSKLGKKRCPKQHFKCMNELVIPTNSF